MNSIKIFSDWLHFVFLHEKQIELYVDRIPGNIPPKNTIRFLFLAEPPEIENLIQPALLAYNQGRINYLITHNEFLLKECKNSVNFPLAGTWIQNYDFPQKEFAVSTLLGGKRKAPGHLLRFDLWQAENQISKIKTNFFTSGNQPPPAHLYNSKHPVLGDKKEPLFDSQFSIVIENARRNNWFTEKVIDAFQTKTVPIYWGCPNISQWFDIRGMLMCENLSDLIDACNNLNCKTYEKMLPYVEQNYLKSMNFVSTTERLIKIIKERV